MNFGNDKGSYINLGSLVSDGTTSLDKTTEYKISFTAKSKLDIVKAGNRSNRSNFSNRSNRSNCSNCFIFFVLLKNVADNLIFFHSKFWHC